VTLTHNNILNNGFVIGEYMQFTDSGPAVRAGAVLPLLRHGGGEPGGDEPRGVRGDPGGELSIRSRRCRRVQGEKCTALHSVPTMFIAMLEHPEFGEFDISTLRTGITGAAPVPDRADEEGHDDDAHVARS
jgi:fatty-acyl-CoA synthase